MLRLLSGGEWERRNVLLEREVCRDSCLRPLGRAGRPPWRSQAGSTGKGAAGLERSNEQADADETS